MPQIEDPRDSYRNALVIVMGDDSEQSRQYAQYLDWTFQSLLFAFLDGRGSAAEEAIREVLPAETLRLAIDVNWIPYLDDQGDPFPGMEGDVDVCGYAVTQEFYDAFLSLLPIDEYMEYAKGPWVRPTPEEIVDELYAELNWGKMILVEKMQIENNTQYTRKLTINSGVRTISEVSVLPQNSKERRGVEQLLRPPMPTARRNAAQDDHRATLLKVIRKYSKKYAELEEDQLRWRRP